MCGKLFNHLLVEDMEVLSRIGGVTHTCTDSSQLQLHDESTLRAIQERLLTAMTSMSTTDFAELTTRLGWNVSPLLTYKELSPTLAITKQTIFDTMHVLFVRGVFNDHIGAMVEALQPLKVTTHMIHNYVHRWMWPRQVRTSTGKDVFSKERIQSCIENKYLVCQASEGLSLVPVLANYVRHGLLRNESAAIR